MNKIFSRNKVIVTALALLIALAGYLNYSDTVLIEDKKAVEANNNSEINDNYTYDVVNEVVNNDKEYEEVYNEDTLLEDTSDIGSMDGEEMTEEPGKAIFTSGQSSYGDTVKAKVNREQVRSKNREELQKIVDNDKIDKEQKQQAIDAMVEITNYCEMENNIETILEAKGYSDIIVTLSDNQADVIVGGKMEDSDRAVIEDVVTRKTGIQLEGIVITPIN